MPNKEEKRITEQSSLYEHLEKMSVDELTVHINEENKKVALRSIPSKCRTPMASTVRRYKPSSPEASAALRKPGNQEKTTWRMVGTSSAINISQSRISYSVFLPAAQPHSCFPSCSIARKKAFLRVASSTIPTLPSPKQPIIL